MSAEQPNHDDHYDHEDYPRGEGYRPHKSPLPPGWRFENGVAVTTVIDTLNGIGCDPHNIISLPRKHANP